MYLDNFQLFAILVELTTISGFLGYYLGYTLGQADLEEKIYDRIKHRADDEEDGDDVDDDDDAVEDEESDGDLSIVDSDGGETDDDDDSDDIDGIDDNDEPSDIDVIMQELKDNIKKKPFEVIRILQSGETDLDKAMANLMIDLSPKLSEVLNKFANEIEKDEFFSKISDLMSEEVTKSMGSSFLMFGQKA